MLKAYKFRLYPNKEQQEYFAKCFGCVRFIYNKMLEDKINYYKETGQMKSFKNIFSIGIPKTAEHFLGGIPLMHIRY